MIQLNVPGSCECLSVDQVPGTGWVVMLRTMEGTELKLLGSETDERPNMIVGKRYNLVLDAVTVKA